MAPKGKCRGRKARTLPPPAAALPPPPPPSVKGVVTVADLTEEILRRLAPADLLRAALACHRWCRAASQVLPRAPPLLGYFFHPQNPAKPPPSPKPTDKTHHPAVFVPVPVPLDAASPRLSLDPTAARSLSIQDVHLGLVLLLQHARPQSLLPSILAIDPASRRRVLLSPPPRGALRGSRSVIGVAVLSRAHPSRLSFDAICLTVDGDLPRAWVTSVRDGGCAWRALPLAKGVVVDFDPWWFEARCVHAAGNIYGHICNSSRLLQLDPRTLEFSFMPVPAVLGDRFEKYRIGEDSEDGRLCMAAIVNEDLQIWVRGEGRQSDRGWVMEREMCMTKVLDTVPRLPKDTKWRMICTWLSNIDYARTGKVFVKTWGYGRYSFDTETGKLERLMMTDGKEYGDPMYAYTLSWPPEFLAPRD
ncbi:hypothetical protein HU200_042235 [Digitaria exilis]|uniref:F-box domain-containing protein n=1 Tax=Digitaria exilis TaxID=1010633 RepID=A0A835BE07_9POAL|nr:hypothetical protein HU200_042235 [Digitaria exilis]